MPTHSQAQTESMEIPRRRRILASLRSQLDTLPAAYIHVLTITFIFTASWLFFIWLLELPNYFVFDEIRYVSAARQFISGGMNENWSHPPLAKALISIGIRLLGDQPMGWRFMSSLFGALSLAMVYFWAYRVFQSTRDAITVTLLCLLNQIHFVESRLALLDGFMTAFMIAGMAAFHLGWLRRHLARPRRLLYLSIAAISFGLGVSCKWFAAIPLILCAVLCVGDSTLSYIRRIGATTYLFGLSITVYSLTLLILLNMKHPHYGPSLDSLPQVKGAALSKIQVALERNPESDFPNGRTAQSKRIEIAEPGESSGPVLAPEFLNKHELFEDNETFVHYGKTQLFRLQYEMLKAQLKFVNPHHPFRSSWYEWVWSTKPQWYDIRMGLDGTTRNGMIVLVNPLIAWLGALASLYCLWLWARKKVEAAGLFAFFYFGLWLVWSIAPRNIGFLYYYYPATMILSFTIVTVARELNLPKWMWTAFLVSCAASFVWFYPLLTDQIMTNDDFFKLLRITRWFSS